ncbi:GT2 family glycosyltransferase [Thermocatellispora tengchongensis]|uniref:GT2 family glycosyltransferase n=1 Tax=Thermocatellispora tengchongensis TaxID=1073253 RepID=A0A840PKA4_9ACTN|nr:glycosyltransferase [Thermocatellispora tengchongensis]MBB5138040.1 GT2 family glycosyltransferase [Thermocatellispora tengchongensis]
MTGGSGTDAWSSHRPLIRHNDYSPLEPPRLGEWQPTLPVSVIIPAHGGQRKLDLTLAALAAQTYPVHLLEVIVVDDGSTPPLRLPEIAPIDTRIVTPDPGGWGIGHALNAGAAVADGVLIQRLDADMVTCKEHIEALARWHHLTDYVVTIGYKSFVEFDEAREPTPEQVHDAVRGEGLGAVFDLSAALPSSTEATIAKLDGLRASRNPYHVCTGPTLCLHRKLFHKVGGIDPEVPRGEDTEFAYRLAAAGSVFIPDPAARAVHLGLPGQRTDKERTVRVAGTYLAHRVPLRRDLRKDRGRHWKVPYVEVVLEVEGASEESVRAAVTAAFAGTVDDVLVTLVAPWSKLPAGRRPVLDDPDLDLRLIRELFSHDERVRFADEPAPSPAPIAFRYTGPVTTPLGPDTLKRMIEELQEHRAGSLITDVPGDPAAQARLDRTEALSRAHLLTTPDTTVDETIEATHGIRHGTHTAYWPAPEPPKPTPAPAPAPPAPPRPQPADRPSLFRKIRNTLNSD